MDPWLFLIDALVVYRLTRLITKDTLFQEVRWWILRRWPSELTTYPDDLITNRQVADGITLGEVEDTPVFLAEKDGQDHLPIDQRGSEWRALDTYKLTELLECPYCASVWIAFVVVALRFWWGWWQYPASALALAGVVALIFARLDNE